MKIQRKSRPQYARGSTPVYGHGKEKATVRHRGGSSEKRGQKSKVESIYSVEWMTNHVKSHEESRK